MEIRLTVLGGAGAGGYPPAGGACSGYLVEFSVAAARRTFSERIEVAAPGLTVDLS